MTTSIGDSKRRLIPRWRDSLSSSALGELDPSRPMKGLVPLNPAHFEAAIIEWRASPSLPTAFEVLIEGITHGRSIEAVPAATYLYEDQEATPIVRALAKSVLDQSAGIPTIRSDIEVPNTKAFSNHKIAAIRHLLRDVPNNPLLWVDLAREYILKGQYRQSLRAMEVALTIGPDVRFVLRSATRLFIHTDDTDKALFYLNKSKRTQLDPWLLAAQIASSEIADSPQRYIKQARAIQSSGDFSSNHISELSGALATLDFSSGNAKSAKRNFKLSLEHPTENALAQAVHIQAQSLKIEIAPEILASTMRTYEATALTEFMNTNWQLAINAASDWYKDEPFSTRPLIFASYISSVALNNHDQSRNFARLGIEANPGNPELLNNLAVAEAYLGNLEKAEEYLSQISPNQTSEFGDVTATATRGLIAFRKGNPDLGRSLYQEALEKASDSPMLIALAYLHLTREELDFGSDRSQRTFELALNYLTSVPRPTQLPLIAMAEILGERLASRSNKGPSA